MSRVTCFFVLLLSLSAMGADGASAPASPQNQSQTQNKKPAAKRPAAKATAKTPAAATPQAPGVSAEEVRQLREALNAQNQRVQQLEQHIQQMESHLQRAEMAATTSQTKVGEIESSSSKQQQSLDELKKSMTDVGYSMTALTQSTQESQKRFTSIEGLLGRLRWTGDVRVRLEDFFLEGQQPRIRERIRLRLGLEGALNDDFVAGVAFASGTLADPTSTNDTLTNFFERKVVGWDRGYITYNPKAHKWLSLTGGKFAFNWRKTNQTFDPDINPEGFSEKFSFDIKQSKFLKNVTFNAIQLFYFENSAVAKGANGNDSFAAGGQMQIKLQPAKRWTLTPSYTALNWRNINILLTAPAFAGAFPVSGTTNIVCNPVTTLGTSPSCAFATVQFAPNGMTNAYHITSRAANGNLTRVFNSQFLYSDLIVDSTFDLGYKRFPLNLMAEYEENLRAENNRSHMYQGEISIGQQKGKGDILAGYAFLRQEQDSVIAAFGESDQRNPTNVLQHKAYFQYRFAPKVTLGYTLFVGRILDSAAFAAVPIPGGGTDALQPALLAPGVLPGQRDKFLKRMQFDVIYNF